jgi:hypothetical protein
MLLVFLQNSALILVTLFILLNHKADYTLYMAIMAILFSSVRMMFTRGSTSTKITYFLIQSFVFSVTIWLVLFPRQFHNLLG